MSRIQYIEGVVPAGATAICMNPADCIYGKELKRRREELGLSRIKISLSTIRFVRAGVHYTIETPHAMREYIYKFDLSGPALTCQTTTEDYPYRIPLGGKTVTTRDVDTMTPEAKERLDKNRRSNCNRRATRSDRDRENALARISNAKIKARLA